MKNSLLAYNGFFYVQFLCANMCNFIHSCLTMNFIKLGGVLIFVMALNIIFFHYCNLVLADEVDNTLVMWDNKTFRAPFTVEKSSFIICFSFLGCQHVILHEIIAKKEQFTFSKFAK